MKRSLLFSERLRGLLEKDGLNAAQFGKKIGISHVAVGNYLKGRIPDRVQALKIARYFNLSMEELLTGADPLDRIARAKEIADEFPGSQEEKQMVFEGVSATDWRTRALTAELQVSRLTKLLTEIRSSLDSALLETGGEAVGQRQETKTVYESKKKGHKP